MRACARWLGASTRPVVTSDAAGPAGPGQVGVAGECRQEVASDDSGVRRGRPRLT